MNQQTLIGSDTARIAGVPSSLVSTLPASQEVTITPTTQIPITRMIGLTPEEASSMRTMVTSAVPARVGPVLKGSLGYLEEYLDCWGRYTRQRYGQNDVKPPGNAAAKHAP